MWDMFKSAKRHSREMPRRINGQSAKIMETFYLGDTVWATGGVIDSVVTNIRSGWSKFRDLVSFLANGDLPLGAKDKLSSACVRSITLFGSETWCVKAEDVIRRKKTDARVCNTRPDNLISVEKLTWLKLNSMWECIQDRKEQQFCDLGRIEECAWSSNCG